MDFSKRLSISYYKNIAVLNEEHQVYIAQHQVNKKIFVKKNLSIFNASIYHDLQTQSIKGIPQIYELYEEDSSLTVIEEYIFGETLQEKIDQRCLNSHDINYYIADLCDILIKLHNFTPPIIHRDIKPSNIIVTPDHRLFLLDYNAAKYFTDTNSSDTVLLGTKGYAAPEQYGFGSSTQKTDIYAVGILLKELTESLHLPTNKFDDLIEKCTPINPSDRFESVSELCNALPYNTTMQIPNPSEKSWRAFILPGFRTHRIWKMLIAFPAYAVIFFLSLTLQVEDATLLQLWIERLFCSLIFLSFIFVWANYLNIQTIFPLCQHNSHLVRFFGMIILNMILITALSISMSLLVTIL